MSESWRNSVLSRLRERNKTQVTPFKDLIEKCEQNAEKCSVLRQENQKLLFLNEQLQKSASVNNEAEETCELKKKVYALQEELTSLHRTKGENAQTVIDLGNSVKGLEMQLAEKASTIIQLENEIKVRFYPFVL